MEPMLHYRPGPVELEDLVARFVEEKLGRLDWQFNWPLWKQKQGNDKNSYLNVIRTWFHQNGEDVNPEDIANHIERMIVERPGRWR